MPNDFRGHPEGCADEGMPERIAELRSYSEISELHLSRGGEEDVGGFDIPVDLALAVQVVEAEQELAADDGDVGL